MLSDKKDYYEKNKESLSVNPSKYKNEFPFLKEVDSLVLCNAQLDLNSAYSNFFREIKKGNGTQGFPKHKSKKRRISLKKLFESEAQEMQERLRKARKEQEYLKNSLKKHDCYTGK